MAKRPSVPTASLPPGSVGRAGPWTVVRKRDGAATAVSSRCRHQLADLSKGALDKEGCLVCPWHGARYDVDSGAMVEGPKGLLWYQGRTPGYTQLVKAYSQVLKLRRRSVAQQGDDLVVQD
jgi:nitrite reductase/ring-hydroxylating ferredoxin subunit